MGTIFGIEVPDPDEMMASQNAEFEQLKAGGDQNAFIGQAMFNMFGGNDATRKAGRVKQKLFEAQQSVQRKKGESDYDYQMREATAIRNAVAGDNPELAIAANERYLELITAKEQQRKLMAQNDDADFDLSTAKKEAELLGQRFVMFTDPTSGIRQVADMLPPEIGKDPEKMTEWFKEYQKKHPEKAQYLDLTDGVTALKAEGLLRQPVSRSGGGGGGSGGSGSAIEGSLLGRTDIGKRMASITVAANASNNMAKTLTAFQAAPLSYSPAVASMHKKAAAMGNWLQNVVNVFGGSHYTDRSLVNPVTGERWNEDEIEANIAADNSVFTRWLGAPSLKRFFDENQIQGSQQQYIEGKMLDLAYAIAKMHDPGGRLSDQDVEMAMKMITGDGDPETIGRLFDDRIEDMHSSMIATIKMAKYGHFDRPGENIYVEEASRYEESIAKARESVINYTASIQKMKKDGTLLGGIPVEEATESDRAERVRQAREKAAQRAGN